MLQNWKAVYKNKRRKQAQREGDAGRKEKCFRTVELNI